MDRTELGAFLRTCRSRVTPADVGLAAGSRRRVSGLRREEVALLAGISVDYLVRIEQGRGPQPSAQVLAALSRALRLGDDERDHLFHLAGSAPPRPGQIDSTVRASTLRILERLTDLPALVVDAKGDILAWNDLAAALIGDFSAWSVRNVAWQRFLGSNGRVSRTPEEDERTAMETVADLRAVAGRYPEDAGLRKLLADLRAAPRFVELWGAVCPSERRSSTKTVVHPELGSLTFDCDALHLPDTDQRLIVYSSAPGSPGAEALALLRVVGLQSLTTGG